MNESKWNFNGVRIFLTYPKCPLAPEDLWKRLECLVRPYLVSKFIVGGELHADGSPHLHAVIILVTRLHSRDARFFDIDGYHPHWKGTENPERTAEYCRKEGNYTESWPTDVRGYRNAKADREARNRDLERANLIEAIPFELPTEVLFTEEMLHEKKRHYWFVSKPDWGKTAWVENTFRGREIYKRVETDYPFDDYDGERIIVYDDFIPKLAELLNVSNTVGTRTPVFGNTRYGKRYWKIDHDRVMIVLTNVPPTYVDVPSFMARFNVIHLD